MNGITVEQVTHVDGLTGERKQVYSVMASLEWCDRPRLIGSFLKLADAYKLAALLAKRT